MHVVQLYVCLCRILVLERMIVPLTQVAQAMQRR